MTKNRSFKKNKTVLLSQEDGRVYTTAITTTTVANDIRGIASRATERNDRNTDSRSKSFWIYRDNSQLDFGDIIQQNDIAGLLRIFFLLYMISTTFAKLGTTFQIIYSNNSDNEWRTNSSWGFPIIT